MGLFYPFVNDKKIKMVGVEAGGHGIKSGKHAARFSGGKPGVLHGTMTYLLQDQDGQVNLTHSVSAGLDYPAVGPEHSFYHDTGRIQYTSITDKEALAAFDLLSQVEGIIPALESAHAVAEVVKILTGGTHLVNDDTDNAKCLLARVENDHQQRSVEQLCRKDF